MMSSAENIAALGFRVFPVKKKSKQPLIENWPNAATTDNGQIRAWWTRFPGANIGVACGEKSNVFVIDIDIEKGKLGESSLEKLQKKHGNLPETRESETGTGGRHLFFKYPKDTVIKNRVGFMPGLDIRGEGGFVVMPPSVHENGKKYKWKRQITPAECPKQIISVIKPQTRMPWDRGETKSTKKILTNDDVIKRASAYLEKIPEAIEGSAGHNALLWAASCLVIGFQLSDDDALRLLWDEYNPRCSPPWDRSKSADVKDFERKIREAKDNPLDKEYGWLLKEKNEAEKDRDALASMIGESFARNYVERVYARVAEKPEEIEEPIEFNPKIPDKFPLHCLPVKAREYVELVSDVQVVDPAGIALSVLCCAGGAMGNAFRLRLKKGFDVPPVLWGAIISRSGSNKSGPFREVIKPLRAEIPLERLESRMMNPQGQLLIEDTTTEAILEVMGNNQRGLLMANGEGAGWVGAFDRYSKTNKKRVSVDETIWLKMWDCDSYQKNRKTDSENTFIHNAACGVLVCIQPRKMAEVFDPSQFASGLVPRLLVVYLPKTVRKWSEREMNPEAVDWWKETIIKLRIMPFAEQDPNTGEFFPNIIMPIPTAKQAYVKEFNRIAWQIEHSDDMAELFFGKAQGMIGRVALVLHGLEAACDMHSVTKMLGEKTMLNAIEIMRYLVKQQLSVYNLASEGYAKIEINKTLQKVREKAENGVITAHQLVRANNRRWKNSDAASEDLAHLAKVGYGTWDEVKKVFVLKRNEGCLS